MSVGRKIIIAPPLAPKQDRAAGLPASHEGGVKVSIYDAKTALNILNLLAEGHTLKAICTVENAMPTAATFRRWVTTRPELAKAYREAVLVSAVSLEEKALDLAHDLSRQGHGYTGTEVRAKEVAMGQYRWSAARRDPAKYGDRAQVNIAVPIQINTGLDLGQGSTGEPSKTPNVYEIEATVVPEAERSEAVISQSEAVAPSSEVPALPSPEDPDVLRLTPKRSPQARLGPRKRVLVPGKDREKRK